MRTRVVRGFRWALPPKPVALSISSRLPEGETDKPPLLFVHGATEGAWIFEEHWMPEAAARGWSAYAVDLRGHGGSGPRRWSHSLRDYEHDVMQAIVRLPKRPILVGHSMGCLVVERVIEYYAARAAILLAPPGSRHGLGTALQILKRHPMDLLNGALGRSLPPRPGYFFAQGRDPHGYCGRLVEESAMSQWQLILFRRARSTKSPVLVIGAGEDALNPLRDSFLTAASYGAPIEVIKGVGHALMLEENWKEPLDAILSWLERALD